MFSKSSNQEKAKKLIHHFLSSKTGPGASLPKSESDDFSDLASDLDFDEIASERSRPDGSSTEEIARDFCVINHPGQGAGASQHAGGTGHSNGGQRGERRQKHRPRSLNLSRSHSSTSDEEGEGEELSLIHI